MNIRVQIMLGPSTLPTVCEISFSYRAKYMRNAMRKGGLMGLQKM